MRTQLSNQIRWNIWTYVVFFYYTYVRSYKSIDLLIEEILKAAIE